MEGSDSNEGQSASERIDKRIAELGDWRGETLSRMRKLINEADPDVVEEVKWVKATSPGTPTWSHDGIICTGEAYTGELAAFVDFAAGRIENPCTVADALEAIYVAEACELSRAEARPVRIDEVRVTGAVR